MDADLIQRYTSDLESADAMIASSTMLPTRQDQLERLRDSVTRKRVEVDRAIVGRNNAGDKVANAATKGLDSLEMHAVTETNRIDTMEERIGELKDLLTQLEKAME